MKRTTYLFPLMAMTALSLTLAACDDKKDETAAADGTVVETPATTETAAPTETAPVATVAPVTVEGATAFATAEGSTNGAVFVTLTAPAEADKLVGASTDVASTVEIHESTMEAGSGTMSMRKVDSIDLQPGQPVSLKPDGYHLMLLGLKAPLAVGQTFNITLDFDKSADVTVPVTVTTAGGSASDDAATGLAPEGVVSPEADDAVTPTTEGTATTAPDSAAPSSTEDPTSTTTAPAEGTETPAQ